MRKANARCAEYRVHKSRKPAGSALLKLASAGANKKATTIMTTESTALNTKIMAVLTKSGL
jgi:hypothetical protein|tara:strand:- start:959 stop:1141 length:183 start_codon:yes stop_codon:yes gene_type:complete